MTARLPSWARAARLGAAGRLYRVRPRWPHPTLYVPAVVADSPATEARTCAAPTPMGCTTMHELIISPFLGSHLVLRPGQRNAVKISRARYAQLQATGPAEACPG